jgi:hypothetical protein
MRALTVFLGYAFSALCFAIAAAMILAGLASAPPIGVVIIIFALWRMFGR